MRLYLSTRRTATLFVVSIMVAALPMLSATELAFPDVIGGGGGTVIPLVALAPAVQAIVAARSFTARRIHLDETAVRRTGWADAVLLMCADGVVVGLSLVLPGGDSSVARNAVMLVGFTAVVTCLVSPAAAAAAVTFLILLVVTYGRTAPDARFVRVLQAPPDAFWPTALALALTSVAFVTLARRDSGQLTRR